MGYISVWTLDGVGYYLKYEITIADGGDILRLGFESGEFNWTGFDMDLTGIGWEWPGQVVQMINIWNELNGFKLQLP